MGRQRSQFFRRSVLRRIALMPESDRMDPLLKALLISISVFVFGMLATNDAVRASIMNPFAVF
jgi:Mg2+/Co2+ transporter CorC